MNAPSTTKTKSTRSKKSGTKSTAPKTEKPEAPDQESTSIDIDALIAASEKVAAQPSHRSAFYAGAVGQGVLKIIENMRARNCPFRQIAEWLNDNGIPNARGGQFTVNTVSQLYRNHFEEASEEE